MKRLTGMVAYIGLLLLAIPNPAHSPQGPAARIKIDTDRVTGEIDNLIYGNFIEHLGDALKVACSREITAFRSNGYRKDVFDATKKLHVSVFCAGPAATSPPAITGRTGLDRATSGPRAWNWHGVTTESNRFGTHEFLNYAEMLGTQPYICVNLGTGTWDEANFWVEYTNLQGGTRYSDLRRNNGREKPWGVTHWGSGQRNGWAAWQMGYKSAEDYSKFALEAAKLMKWTDPNIKLIAAGSSNYNADWVGWNRTVLQNLKNHMDYLSLHLYVGKPQQRLPEFLTSSLNLSK